MKNPSMSRRFWPLLIVCLSVSLLTAGCFTIPTYAPYGRSVKLLPPDKPAEVRREYRTWFILGGLFPLDNTMPADIIAKEKLTEARVIVQDTVEDAGIAAALTFILPILILPQTVVIEGNRAPVDSPVESTVTPSVTGPRGQ
jgi:hypothetical protein